ncbi:MAG: hypothetical protein IJ737_01535 [Ruminococcus sp.]|nr:hypothetical protein [Ruminococcus sp.]MBR2282982.1 hypothetical protein [Ruminococcus sp.]
MRKYLAVLICCVLAAAMAACGKEPAEETTVQSSEAAADISEDDDTGFGLPEFDPHAGINMTAVPLDSYEIPDDWERYSDGTVSFMAPAGLEKKDNSLSGTPVFQSEDKVIMLWFFEPHDWSVPDDDEDTAADPEEMTTEEEIAAFRELGIEHEGSRLSLYKGLLSFTEKDRTEENAEAFERLARLKAECIGMAFPGVRYLSEGGRDIFVHYYEGVFYDPASEEDEHKAVWVSAFRDENTEQSVMIRSGSQEMTEMIASTARFEDK